MGTVTTERRINVTTEIRNADPLYTVDETADYLTVGIGSVNYWRHAKTGPKFVRVGKNIRYRQSDLDAWIEERTVSQTTTTPIDEFFERAEAAS
jgi:excisionase family DNA binding protein